MNIVYSLQQFYNNEGVHGGEDGEGVHGGEDGEGVHGGEDGEGGTWWGRW